MQASDLKIILANLPVVEGTNLKQFFRYQLLDNIKHLEKERGTFDEVLANKVLIIARKKGLIEELEVSQTVKSDQIRHMCWDLPYKEAEDKEVF